MLIATNFVHLRNVFMSAALAVVMSGCATVSSPVNVADTVAKTPSLSTLNGLLTSSGLSETLKGPGPFTVFAPTNEAFKAIPAKTMETLSKDPVELKYVLTFHVLPALALAKDVKNSKVKSLNGATVELSKAGDTMTIESAVVTQSDMMATNGVVHVIDAVLIPPAKK